MHQGGSTGTILLIALLLSSGASGNFHEGEFVPTARRAQFHGSRTQWHDLLGRHCPRFGQESVVAVPLPLPQGYKAVDKYKISFAFDGDRLLTPWRTIIGGHAPPVPLLAVELTHSAEVLTAVKARVEAVPAAYLQEHAELVEQFQNATHWPKHLLVRYHWAHVDAVDGVAGLYVLFAAGILACGVVIAGVLASYHGKLGQFLEDLSSDDVPRSAAVGTKAE